MQVVKQLKQHSFSLMILLSFLLTFNNTFATNPNTILGKWNAIVINDLTSVGEIEGRTFIGGNYSVNNSHQFGFALNGNPNTDNVFAVIGSATTNGQANIKVFNGSAVVGGTVANTNWFQFMNGGTLTAASLWPSNNQPLADIIAASHYWQNLTANSTAQIPSGQPGPLKFNCASGQGVAVFNLTDTQVFENNLVQQMELVVAPETHTVIININSVDGNVNWSNGNLVGLFDNQNWRSRVIWNLYTTANGGDMGTMSCNPNMKGALVAPTALVTGNSNFDGTVVAQYLNINSEIHIAGGWNGNAPYDEPKASVGDKVWLDANHNGIQDSGENGVQNVTVQLYTCTGNLVSSTTTNASGVYGFSNLSTASYYIKFIKPSGYVFSSSNQGSDNEKDSDADTTGKTACFDLIGNQNDISQDAGLYIPAPVFGSLGNRVWIDLNKNGLQDNGENGLQWVSVELYTCDNHWLGFTSTDANGNYLFDSLAAGSYYVKFYLIDNNAVYKFTTKDAGADSIDSDVNPATFVTNCVTLAQGENNLTVDAGVYLKVYGSIGNKVWNDTNKNGIQDNGEAGVFNVNVKLRFCSDSLVTSTHTDSLGVYYFDSLAAGSYYVSFELPSGYVFIGKDKGANDGLDSDADSVTGKTICLTLTEGENNFSVDAGIFKPAPVFGSIGNRVWIDTNKNGLQDNIETGLSGVKVELYTCANSLLTSSVTDVSGLYLFDSLSAGSYYVKFTLTGINSSYIFTQKNAGFDSVDSDVNPANGVTECIVLNNGENNLTLDAGVYKQEYGSIGDKVWNDVNKNGIQENGEAGVPGVNVKLYTCADILSGTKVTDSLGLYHFGNLNEGSYYVKFELPLNYTFSGKDIGTSDEFDSDADSLTGKTSCFTLGYAENQVKWDAGISLKGTPHLTINKDDGILIMPDSGKSVTYTIKYSNTGSASLFNASIVDTLPAGTRYLSCNGGSSCGETGSGSSIVTYSLGTLAANTSGQVTLTALVSSTKPEYLNVAYLTGKDAADIKYTVSDNDLDIHDTTSCGGGAGVESRGDMAELLLRRNLKIQYKLTTPLLAKSNSPSMVYSTSLGALIPVSGPYNSAAVETTPFDILGISNAVSAYAVDYKLITEKGERRIGGIFSTITTAPLIYDHTKAVCDRLAGAVISNIELVQINGKEFYAAKFTKPGNTDYAISFSIYETGSSMVIENKWTYSEYSAPAGAVAVYNFQVWSSTIEGTIELVKNIINNAAGVKSVTYLNNNQVEPVTFISNASYDPAGKIKITVKNNEPSKELTFKIVYRVAQSGDEFEQVKYSSADLGETEIALQTGIISDAKIYMTQSQGFIDEAFVSSGAYTYITGEKSSVTNFNTTGYQGQDLNNYPGNSIVLPGGAKIEGELSDWVSVVRSLNASATSYDLSDYNKIMFTTEGTGKIDVFISTDDVKDFNYFVRTIELTGGEQKFTLNFSEFSQLYGSQVPFDAAKIKTIGFIIEKSKNQYLSHFNYEFKDIAFLSNVTGIEDAPKAPQSYGLAQNFPNPFNPSTVIKFSVPQKETVTLKIYDILGNEVKTLVSDTREAGSYSVEWNGDNNFGANIASGIYIYKITAGRYTESRKMMFLK